MVEINNTIRKCHLNNLIIEYLNNNYNIILNEINGDSSETIPINIDDYLKIIQLIPYYEMSVKYKYIDNLYIPYLLKSNKHKKMKLLFKFIKK